MAVRNKMETGFDKEIDALLRDRGLRTITLAERSLAGDHLDADALSGFAENALPANTRAVYMNHLADCGDCRGILSNIIALNESTATEQTVAAPVIEASPVPWYRKIFLAPNLAYVMGGLVLVFGGLITISLFQNSYYESSSAISQMDETEVSARGPMAEDVDTFSTSTESSAMPETPANTSANANTLAKKSGETESGRSAANVPSPAEHMAKQEPAGEIAPGMPLPKPTPAPRERDETVAMAEAAKPADKEFDDMMARQQQAPVAGAPPATQAGPSRNIQNTQRDNRALQESKRAGRSATRSDESVIRMVGGKTFEQRDNIWYDREYKGGTTTNIRRSTNAYRKLDSGLRVITDQLSGTVIVVWKETSYRIQ